MALWQYDLEVLPRAAVAKARAAGVSLYSDDLEDAALWKGVALPPAFEPSVAALLHGFARYSSNWRVYGDEEGTRVDITTADDDTDGGEVGEAAGAPIEGSVDGVRLRLDTRALDPALLAKLLALVVTADCVLMTDGGTVVDPALDRVWIELQLSAAAEFTRDPQAYIAWLQRRGGLE